MNPLTTNALKIALMLTLSHVLIGLLFSSCGVQPAAAPAASPQATSADKDHIDYADEDPKEVVVEYRKDGNNLALVVKESKDLPTCDNSSHGKLAYVKTEDTFFECEDETWQEIEIKGEKGDTGPQGPQGPAPTPIPLNQWMDSITGKYWLIGGNGNYAAVATFTQACSNGWRLPTRAEGIAASQHGLKTASNAIGGPVDFWTSELDISMANYAYIIVLATSNESGRAMSESHGVMCIKQ